VPAKFLHSEAVLNGARKRGERDPHKKKEEEEKENFPTEDRKRMKE
jgi:hypothetical protein